ncbi:SRPBCC family protein [Paractinoplanes lichenicola]|uniref:SRPBCC family protein n=1 Tax=Paractinoplanes lichenicola TaxID=2802976 RepID=A0ABS1VT47_9ACTN|nr:SRPBCC family protein [Actinoplanes lichenicola]MBL7257640.1 SRPBCC family protein [Actinoplanes lichenicola]
MIDVDTQISQVRRELGSRTLEAGEARVSTISQVYPTGIDDLWDVVTNPERISRWFMPVEGELKEGGHYQLTGNASGTITKCDKPSAYAATWEYADQVSWIEVRLTPEGDGTRFELEHVAHVADEWWDQFGPGATGVGWDMGLLGLANHLTDPSAVLDPVVMATWHETPEGQSFLRQSSDLWVRASIAAGTDEQAAKEAGERTYAFYTGTGPGAEG